jgi:hypothetical protein
MPTAQYAITLSLLCITVWLVVLTRAGHFLNADGTPYDPYHELHLPHDPPLYPTLSRVPHTAFSCEGRDWGLHADTEAYCQVKVSVVSSAGNGDLLTNTSVMSRAGNEDLLTNTSVVSSTGNGDLLTNTSVMSRAGNGH